MSPIAFDPYALLMVAVTCENLGILRVGWAAEEEEVEEEEAEEEEEEEDDDDSSWFHCSLDRCCC